MSQFLKDALLRRQEVQKACAISRSSLWQKIKDGSFPPPIKTSVRSRRWAASAINAYIEQQLNKSGVTV